MGWACAASAGHTPSARIMRGGGIIDRAVAAVEAVIGHLRPRQRIDHHDREPALGERQRQRQPHHAAAGDDDVGGLARLCHGLAFPPPGPPVNPAQCRR